MRFTTTSSLRCARSGQQDIAALREVRLERYKGLQTPPANTLLVVSRLAEPEFLIEIDVVAALPAR